MYILNVLNQNSWDIEFTGTPFVNTKTNGSAKVLKEWAVLNNSALCFNLAFFNFNTTANIKKGCAYRTLEYVKSKTQVIGYDGGNLTNERLTLNNGSACGGWKLAIKDNIVKSLGTDKRTRNMNGLTADGRYIHCQSTTKVSETAMANWVLNQVKKQYNTGVALLLVQDAGGSTGEYSALTKTLTAGEKEGYNGRAVVTVVTATPKTVPITRTLKVGCKGDDVRWLQSVCGGVEIDGIFGTGTKSAVKKLQAVIGADADGIVGNDTIAKLRKSLGV